MSDSSRVEVDEVVQPRRLGIFHLRKVGRLYTLLCDLRRGASRQVFEGSGRPAERVLQDQFG